MTVNHLALLDLTGWQFRCGFVQRQDLDMRAREPTLLFDSWCCCSSVAERSVLLKL